jgi:TonB family protein
MEAIGPPPPEEEIQFLTHWGDAYDRPRGRRAAAISVLVHVGLVVAVVIAPAAVWNTPQIADRLITPLIAPLSELTQTDPNEGKVNKEFDVAASAARPRVESPPGAGAPKPFQPAQAPAAPAPKPIVLPEPPKIEDNPIKADLPQLAQTIPPPKIETVERPKLVLEDPMAAHGIEPGQGLPLPKATAAEAIRGAMGGGTAGRGGLGLDYPPSADSQPNSIQLLSDPMGVDFRPYLAAVTAEVKRHWMAIWPEAARQGRSGRVEIQFSVDRFGTVPKLVIATGSGAATLDTAAVAAIQQCVPFPVLPKAYKPDIVRLQLNFIYNAPK